MNRGIAVISEVQIAAELLQGEHWERFDWCFAQTKSAVEFPPSSALEGPSVRPKLGNRDYRPADWSSQQRAVL